ncbi:MAG TPA: hypothetical protein VN887_14405 [Candidatus Angelobacter sp.]|nr:hypothetical protein [Candidatus Angelobacter sp.]
MNPLKHSLGLVSTALLLPALFLCTTNILHVGFGIETPNRLLDALLAHTVFKLFLSPVIVLGGPLVVFALNAWQTFHISADNVNEEFVIALSVKRLFSHLLCLALAGGLMLLLLAYAFVENFKVIAR